MKNLRLMVVIIATEGVHPSEVSEQNSTSLVFVYDTLIISILYGFN